MAVICMDKKRKAASIVAIVLIVLISTAFIGDYMYKGDIGDEKDRLYSISGDVSYKTYSNDQIEGLPEPVQRYFRYVLTEGQDYISTMELEHGGQFKTGVDTGWMDISGVEYFTAETPGFVWSGKLKPNPLMWIRAKDSYVDGTGELRIKMYSIIPLGTERGPETDQSELVRWFLETPWFPTALLPRDDITWEPIDENSARATLNHGGHTITATFYFNETGEIVRSETMRYWKNDDGSYELKRYIGTYDAYEEFDGVKVPTYIEVTWGLEEGDHTYVKFTIDKVRFNTR
jgi:hypothetical protein